ncbi:MAG TPA: hypothetical protein VGD21_06105 [Lysobacter sp.]
MTSNFKRVGAGRVATYAVILSCIGASGLLVSLARADQAPDAAALQDEDDARSPPAAVRKRKTAIDEELKQLKGHPWAGEYYQGDGLGANIVLSLAPQAGVSATWHGCLGLYGANEGRIQAQPTGHLEFKFNRSNAKQFGGFPDEVVPVRWGERRYLIPSSQMLDFVNAVNQGFEPRAGAMGRFLLARGDESKPVDGLPTLPDRLLPAIRNKALDVGVVKVEPRPGHRSQGYCEKRYRVTVDHGAAHGLTPGIELQVKSPAREFAHLRITAAEVGNAVGEIEIHEADCSKPRGVPDRHWTFTTGAYDPVAADKRIRASRER